MCGFNGIFLGLSIPYIELTYTFALLPDRSEEVKGLQIKGCKLIAIKIRA